MTFWPRRRRQHCQRVDLRGLHAVTLQAKIVAHQYQTLITLTEKDPPVTTPPNPAQAAIDADVAALQASFTTLASVFTDLQAELAALPASVNTSALDALVVTGAAAVAQVQTLDTINPPPAP